MILARIWQTLAAIVLNPLQCSLNVSRNTATMVTARFTFSSDWKILGPFQIGTREAAWGSDPLERYGGFRALEYSDSASFRSSLAVNGTIGWASISVETENPDLSHALAKLDVKFPEIEWQALRNIYGWAAVQWQAWARGEIIVHSAKTEIVLLDTSSLLEVWVDDVHYFGGDFYLYHRAPATLRLKPGSHRIDVRLVRDVRSMGGFGDLTAQAQLELRASDGPLHLQKGVVVSDYVGEGINAGLASPYVSAMLRNDALDEIEILELVLERNMCVGDLLHKVRLLPGQSRPVAFRVNCIGPPPGPPTFRLGQALKYRVLSEEHARLLDLTTYIPVRAAQEPHKVTLLHPAGVVSYAILRPPSHKAEEVQPVNASLPILLALHGAGLEAGDELVKHALDSLPDLPAWVLFPTGGSPWSGDDWHAWGLADVEAAVAMIPDWIRQNDWRGSGVRLDEWLVSGHSNGGQGAWYVSTHRPDNVFAAAVLSAYSSIQNYVPYTFWRPAEPARMAIMHAALNTYRHELLLANVKGMPILQQHGGLDDNVPPYNARLMGSLVREAQGESEYFEFPGKPHFWEGCFVTTPLKKFYEEQLSPPNKKHIDAPLNMRDFSIVTANPGDTGPKHGIHILQLATFGQFGRIDVVFDPAAVGCVLSTRNVRTLQLPSYLRNCNFAMLDGRNVTEIFALQDPPWVVTRVDGKWIHKTESERSNPTSPSRTGRQLVAMDAILRTHGAFHIVSHSNSSAAHHIALQISRNLCQYYAADTIITSDYEQALSAPGNIISVATGDDLRTGFHQNHPIQIENGNEVSVRTHPHSTRFTTVQGHGLAAIYLRPLPNERLELVVWGADAASLDTAARLVPMLPGTGQPDFVIMDNRMLWKGIEGALALGFYDSSWEISRTSFFEGG